MSFIAELKRRNVIRAAGLYLVGAWLIVQVSSTVLPLFGAPQWLIRSVVILLAVGFIPAMVLSWIFELTPEGIKRDEEVTPDESIAPETGRKMDRMIIAVLALALAYFGFDKFVLAPRREAAQIAQAVQSTAQLASTRSSSDKAISDKSIAVLPLTNESGDKDQQYFSDGVSEDLINALSHFKGLKVIGRNSSFQFRDSKDDAATIGRKLGVAHLLEGSVRRAGDAVRVSAELINVSDGSTLWSEHYDRPYKDLFALQDDITQSVAGALKSKLLAGSDAATQSDRPPSGNLDAYAAFLQGKFDESHRTEEGFRKAIDSFTAATRIDPRFALAYARMSIAMTTLATRFLEGTAQRQLNAQARAAADTSLELDPNLAEAHGARGWLLTAVDFDHTGAESEFQRAVQLAPKDGDALFNLGQLMGALGKPEQAIALTRQALATDPLNAESYFRIAQYLLPLGRLDESEQAIRKALDLQPDAGEFHEQLTIIEVLRGDAKAALAAAQQEPSAIWRDTATAQALQIGNDRAAADAALKTLIDKDAGAAAYQVAQVYALRKDADQTFAWLDRAWANRDGGINLLLFDPFILGYKDDPRFAAFCKKVGLPTPSEPAAAAGTPASVTSDHHDQMPTTAAPESGHTP